MSGRWWRAYGRARHDPKLLKLSDRHFRWWFNLVCVASDNDGVLPSCADLAVEFRTSGATMTQALDALVAAGLLDHDETGIRPHNWNGLQYVSDSSSNRVQQFRKRQRNVSVTPSESEADTESEQIQKGEEKIARPRKTKLSEDWQPTEEHLAYAKAQGCQDPSDTAERFKLHHLSKGTLGSDWNRGFQYWCRNEKNFARPSPKVNGHAALPPEDPWRQRLSGYKPGGFWHDGNWGPRPETGNCRAPADVLDAWRQGAT